PANGAVTLMTLHAAKGLEFGAVAMIGLEDGLLPHSRALQAEAEMEEERRLAFVGITRAMRHLHISCARYRTTRGLAERTIPSRFLEELPEHTRVMSDQADVFAGLEGTSWAGNQEEGRGDDFGERRAPQRPAAFGQRAEIKPGPRVVPIDEVMNPGAPKARPAARGGEEFPAGCLVRHPQFGTGKVVSVTRGQNARAMIQFDNVGVKTLVLEYARLQRVR
ncbi:MAG: 3'-5' exonuclease, partial [Planctomycetota bacterium]